MSDTITTREKRPTFGKALIFLIFIILVGAGLAAAALTLRSQEGPKVATAAPQPISATVARVTLQSGFELSESHTGLVSPRRSSQLGFSSGGRITDLRVDVGDRVTAGQTLGVLDTRGLRAQLAAAEASIEEARASRQLAMTTVQRQRQLRDQGHVSQQVVDETAAQASAADARFLASEASADTLRVQIDLARITAPFDGVVTERFSDEGAIAAPGTPIFQLVESSALEARIGLPSDTVAGLEIGETYPLEIEGSTVQARLRSVTGVIDQRQRTVSTLFDILPDQQVNSGAVARLALDRDIGEAGLWVPVSALTEATRGLWSVYAVEAGSNGSDWVAAPRLVEIVHTESGRAFVRGALSNGDRIILDGLQRITPGQPITPVERDLFAGPAGGPGSR